MLTTHLWSSLHIPLQSSLDLDCAVEEWLARAGTAPLSISFGSLERRSTATLPHLAHWFKKFQGLRNPLNSFSFTLCGEDEAIRAFMEEHRQANFNPTQAVNKLVVHLNIENPFSIGETAALPSLELHRNNRLRSLKLSTVYHLLLLPECFTHGIPFVNLKVLDLQSRNFHSSLPFLVRNGVLLKILSQCPNITQLKAFTSGNLFAQTTKTLPDVVLNAQLQHTSLFLTSLVNNWNVKFLDRCDWPALTSLHLGLKGVLLPTERAFVLDTVMTKFGGKLTSLRFTYSSMPREHLLVLLSQLSCLVQLHVEDGMVQKLNVGVGGDESDGEDSHDPTGDEDNVIKALTPGPEGGSSQYYCPRLQYFRWDGRTRFSDNAIIGFLQKRALPLASPVKLKQVVINFDRGPQEDIGSACSQLVADGLRLRLAYRVPRRNAEELSGVYRGLFVEEDPFMLGWN